MSELELCRGLLKQADDLRFHNPREAVTMAESARTRAAALDRTAIGEDQWLALQSEVWAVLGSALRSISVLDEAEGALNVALAFLDACQPRAHPDLLEHARLAQRAAYVRCDQRRFDEALELIDEALEVYEKADAGQAAACALADRGLILGRTGRRQEAILHLGEALDRLEPEHDPRNFLAAIYNTALYLHDLADDPQANDLALKWLELTCRCRQVLPPASLGLMKLRTLEGLTAIRVGRIEEGVRVLWQTQEGFQRLGAVYEQSLTLLHIAAAYLSRGRLEDVRRVACRLFPVFRGLKSDREASAALMLFYNAAQTEDATLELIERVAGTLREAQARNLARGGERS